MDLIFLHGPPAVGKLTVARAGAARTGLPVFHNHLIVDALTPVFPFGSEAFVKLREQIWLGVFLQAAQSATSLIFTFTPERTVRADFPENVARAVGGIGGRARFVALTAPREVLDARLGEETRAEHGKLRSQAVMSELTAAGAFDVAAPPAELTVDTGSLTPEQAAQRIVAGLGL